MSNLISFFRKKPVPALPVAFTPAVSKPRPLLIVKRDALDKEDLDLHASRARRLSDAENYRRLADLADADVRDIDAALSANAECRAKIDAYEAEKMKALDALLDIEMGEQISGLNVIATGERQGASKLTEQDVAGIRASNKPQKELAELYGVSKQQISKIVRRERWTHV